MRVFILCTGRTGSNTFAHACQHITNYTSGHETLTKEFGKRRFDYKDWHIEADNRLSWHLGTLDKKFREDVFYVHLIRDTHKVVSSYAKRYFQPGSMIDAFCEGQRSTPPEKLSQQERVQAVFDYVKTVNDNIELFLKNKSNSMSISIENIGTDFPNFWKEIGAEGDLIMAMNEFKNQHNASKKRRILLLYRSKLFILRIFKHIQLILKS